MRIARWGEVLLSVRSDIPMTVTGSTRNHKTDSDSKKKSNFLGSGF